MKKRILAAAAAVLLALFAPAYAEEAPGAVVQSSCNIVQSDEYYLAYCYAQVHNNSDQVICLEDGVFQLMAGEDALVEEEVSQLWPYFIAPGGDGYLFEIVPFETMPAVTALNYQIQFLSIDPDYAGVQLQTNARLEMDDITGEMSVVCEITNTSSIDAYNPSITFGLYTEAGQMIYADGRNLSDIGIPAGGRVLVRFGVERALVEQWRGYDALPAQAKVNAMFRSGQD